MRSKAPLAVIEQVIMLLVFALAAAVCLRGFAWADSASRHNRNCDLAMVQAQNAAAVIKQTHGDFAAAARHMGGCAGQEQWVINYDEEWVQTDTAETFALRVATEPSSLLPLLGMAVVTVTGDGQQLVELTVSWQEVAADEG